MTVPILNTTISNGSSATDIVEFAERHGLGEVLFNYCVEQYGADIAKLAPADLDDVQILISSIAAHVTARKFIGKAN